MTDQHNMNIFDLLLTKYDALRSFRNQDRAQVWQTRAEQVQLVEPDSFERLTLASECLANRVIGDMSKVRREQTVIYNENNDEQVGLEFASNQEAISHFIGTGPVLEKLKFECSTRWLSNKTNVTNWTYICYIFEQQLRTLTLTDYISKLFPQEVEYPTQIFSSKLRELKFPVFDKADKPSTQIIAQYGGQLTSLFLHEPHVNLKYQTQCQSIDWFPVMPRLKRLSLRIAKKTSFDRLERYITSKIPWAQLESWAIGFTFPCGKEFSTGQLFDILAQMTSLRKLLINFDLVAMGHEYILEFNILMQQKCDQLKKLDKLEVLSFGTSNYWYFCHQFCSSISSIKKLIFKFSNFMFKMKRIYLKRVGYPTNLALPQVESLVLIYEKGFMKLVQEFEIFTSLIPPEDMFYQTLTVRHLTLKDVPLFNPSVLDQLGELFPNLVELNISVLEKSLYKEVTKQDMMQFIKKLKKLCVLRFTDDFAKWGLVSASVYLMAKRALKKHPECLMVVRVPMSGKLYREISDNPKYGKANQLFTDSVKWIRIY